MVEFCYSKIHMSLFINFSLLGLSSSSDEQLEFSLPVH